MTSLTALILCAALLTAIVTPLVAALARRIGAVDAPDARRIHQRPTPRLGGMALFVAFTPAMVWGLATAGHTHGEAPGPLLGLALGGTLIFLLGLWDDLRGVRAEVKLAVQSIAAALACAAGLRVTVIPLGPFDLPLGEMAGPVTVLWLLAATNALNLIDGLDGLACGIAAVAAAVVTLLAFSAGQIVLAIWMGSIMAGLLVFLLFNFHPARVFLGDSGSLTLGFLLAGGSVHAAQACGTFGAYALPVVALAIPLFDTLFSIIRRSAQRRSLFAPDCGHFHHRLLARGLSPRRAALTAWVVCLAAVLLASSLFVVHPAIGLWIALALGLAHIAVFRHFGAIRLRQTIEGLRNKVALARRMRDEITRFETVELHFRRAETFAQWWQAVCLAGRYMGFTEMALALQRRNGAACNLRWVNSEASDPGLGHVMLVVGVHDLRSGPPLQLTIQTPVQDSLETIGRCVTLFTRLIEQYRFNRTQVESFWRDDVQRSDVLDEVDQTTFEALLVG